MAKDETSPVRKNKIAKAGKNDRQYPLGFALKCVLRVDN